MNWWMRFRRWVVNRKKISKVRPGTLLHAVLETIPKDDIAFGLVITIDDVMTALRCTPDNERSYSRVSVASALSVLARQKRLLKRVGRGKYERV